MLYKGEVKDLEITISDVDVVICNKPTTLIKFYIGNVEYQAEDGMTWAEYCNSEYNTFLIIVGDMIVNGGGQQLIDSSNNGVSPNNLIIADATYNFISSGGY